MLTSQRVHDTTSANGSTRVVMLGTGTPLPDPDRSGPATAIVVNGTPYLIDFGPGVIRRAAAAYRNGVTEFGEQGCANIRIAFLTHLHSDHTMGYPDLIFTPWIMGRIDPLEVYGPKGLKAMTRNVLKAWEIDIGTRTKKSHNDTGWRVNVHEIKPGIAYQDNNVKVTAFLVHHGDLRPAFGFRFDTPDRTIVISGDTSPIPALVENAHGCDVLIHEAYSLASYRKAPPRWQKFRRSHHTSSAELAEIANAIKPGLLVLYHPSNAGGGSSPLGDEEILIDEIRQSYNGKIIAARDLDIY
jgi:ribonuclease BN (tRNA processing enzyme)